MFDEGELQGRYFPLSERWPAATLESHDRDGMVFRSPYPPRRYVDRQRIRGMLDRFTQLRSDDEIVRFADDFGALELCECELPWRHRPYVYQPYVVSASTVTGEQSKTCHATWCESFRAWRRFIEQFAAVLEIIENLRRPEPVQPDWPLWNRAASGALMSINHVSPGMPRIVGTRARRNIKRIAVVKHHSEASAEDLREAINHEWQRSSRQERSDWIAGQRDWIADIVNVLIDLGGLRPVVTWDITRKAAINTGWLYGSGLFGVLALQLAVVATGEFDRYTCAVGAHTFTASRRPPSGRTNYFCPAHKGTPEAKSIINHCFYENSKTTASRKRSSAPKKPFLPAGGGASWSRGKRRR